MKRSKLSFWWNEFVCMHGEWLVPVPIIVAFIILVLLAKYVL